ncbi:MAG: lysylphosphatidylglycerol synthase transmembrane domain-containing protein [Candidatus Omnitrophota bacterium]
MIKSLLGPLGNIYKRHKRAFSVLLLIVILALFFIYMKGRKQDFVMLSRLSPDSIFMLCLAALVFKLALGYNFRILISFFDIKLAFKEWFGLTGMAAMANYLLPAKAGLAAQAVYLKKEYGFRYVNYLSSMTGFYAVGFLVNATAGAAMSSYLCLKGLDAGRSLFLLFLAVMAVAGAFLVIIYHFPKLSGRLGFLKGFLEGLKNFHGKPRKTFHLIISQVIVIIAVGIRLLIAFRALGIEVDLVSSTVIALVMSFSVFISITPGNLGIKESLIMLSSSALGISPAQALMVALLDRAMDILVTFGLGYGFTYMLTSRNAVPQDS